MANDLVEQRGTVANFGGWIDKQGGSVACAIALAGVP